MKRVTAGGAEIPALGLGTWRLAGADCRETVEIAIEEGYRHVDTAERYGNERAVGRGLAAADVDREDVFLTTKVAGENAGYDDVIESAKASRDRLGVDYLDLLLLHWPSARVDVGETMAAMADLRQEGVIRHAGVSNFDRRQLAEAREASEVPVVTDQVRFHPFEPKRRLLRYCQDNDVALTAYSPLAHGGVVNDEVLNAIGRKYEKTAAQVAVRWATQHRNVVAIPKASSREHIRENAAALDFSLTAAEMDRIARPSRVRAALVLARGRLGV